MLLIIVGGFLLINLILTPVLYFVQNNSKAAIKISPEATFITEPLTPDGLPDYRRWTLERQRAAAKQGRGMNGVIPLWQAIWPVGFGIEHYEFLAAESGGTLPTKHGPFGNDADKLLEREIADWLITVWCPEPDNVTEEEMAELKIDAISAARVVLEESRSRPFSADEFPPIAQWIERNQEGYALLDAAAACDFFYWPEPSLSHTDERPMLLTSANAIRGPLRIFSMRTYLLIGEGNFEGAANSCLSALRLAHISHQDDYFISNLVSVACTEMALSVILRFVTEPGVPSELLKRVLDDLDRYPPRVRFADSLRSGERMFALDAIIRWSQGRANHEFHDDRLKSLSRSNIDWEALLTRCNEAYDELARVAELPFAQRRSQTLALEAALSRGDYSRGRFLVGSLISSKEAHTRQVGDLILGSFLPSLFQIFGAEDRCKSNYELTRIAVALAIHRSEQGQYPETLDELVPAILSETPKDLFHGLPFQYRKTSNGFVLYSLGPNATDDLGDNSNLQLFRGYRIASADDTVLQNLLADEVSLSPLESLITSIKPDSDDIGIRVPLPVRPLPKHPNELGKAE